MYFFPFPECKREFLAFQWRGWRSECQREECGWCCQSLGTTTMVLMVWTYNIHFFTFRSFRDQPTALNVFGRESNWMIFVFVQSIAEIRRESKNRQPLLFWTWDPIHNSAGSDYHWGRWSIDVGFIELYYNAQKCHAEELFFYLLCMMWKAGAATVIFLVDKCVCITFKCSVTVQTV